MLEKAVRRMKAALTGVQPLEQWLDPETTRKLHTVTRPPTYLVRIALELVFGYPLPRPHEKSAWGAVVSFKGENFEIVDWRRCQWSISGRTGAEAQATQLLNKLKAAARVLDGQLKEECQTLREAEEFSLDNQFQRYQTLFSLFREECLSWMEKEIGQAVLTRSHRKSIAGLLEAFSGESGTRASRVHAHLLAATARGKHFVIFANGTGQNGSNSSCQWRRGPRRSSSNPC